MSLMMKTTRTRRETHCQISQKDHNTVALTADQGEHKGNIHVSRIYTHLRGLPPHGTLREEKTNPHNVRYTSTSHKQLHRDH